MERKWTPGPWSVPHFATNDCKCNCKYILANYGGMGSIATVDVCESMEMPWGDDVGPDMDQATANAYLISAAPDLYEALHEAQEILEAMGVATEKEEAALAKAQGET